MQMWKVDFSLIYCDFLMAAAPESCDFAGCKPVWNVKVIHMPDFWDVRCGACVENMGIIGNNCLLCCGKYVGKISRVSKMWKFCFPQDVYNSVENKYVYGSKICRNPGISREIGCVIAVKNLWKVL